MNHHLFLAGTRGDVNERVAIKSLQTKLLKYVCEKYTSDNIAGDVFICRG